MYACVFHTQVYYFTCLQHIQHIIGSNIYVHTNKFYQNIMQPIPATTRGVSTSILNAWTLFRFCVLLLKHIRICSSLKNFWVILLLDSQHMFYGRIICQSTYKITCPVHGASLFFHQDIACDIWIFIHYIISSHKNLLLV